MRDVELMLTRRKRAPRHAHSRMLLVASVKGFERADVWPCTATHYDGFVLQPIVYPILTFNESLVACLGVKAGKERDEMGGGFTAKGLKKHSALGKRKQSST